MITQLTQNATAKAIFMMIMSMAWFSAMNVVIRMVSEDMHTTQIVFWRNLFSIFILLPLVLAGGRDNWKTQRPVRHFWRSLIGVTGMQLWFYCIATLPLNEATALSFTAPIFTAVFAVVFLGERAGWHRWSAIFIGFAGAVIIIRPDTHNLNADLLIVPLATTFWAMAALLVKSLTRTEPPDRIVMYMSIFMTLLAFPPALYWWDWPDAHQFGLIALIAITSTGAHLSLVRAYAGADIVTLMPFEFGRLLFTALFAWMVFGETADWSTWAGGAIIVASAAYIAYREALHKRKAQS
jgi:drug/metabolite transporter (DMT)-like permease